MTSSIHRFAAASDGPLINCCGHGVLDPQGPIGAAERLILLNAASIMLVVVVPVIVLTLAFAWWYRASNEAAEYRPNWDYSGQIELVVWSIPTMVVILLAGVTWVGSHELDPRHPIASGNPPVRIQVVSMDWKWLFIYPDHHVAAFNDLTIPVDTPIEFILTSATVMNAFFVPQLGSQIYTMPGMTSHLSLMASKPGEYAGQSSHFSGDGFSGMQFTVHAVPVADYRRWIARTEREALPMAADFLSHATQAGNNSPTVYTNVAGSLFDHIVMTAAPVESLPRTGN